MAVGKAQGGRLCPPSPSTYLILWSLNDCGWVSRGHYIPHVRIGTALSGDE